MDGFQRLSTIKEFLENKFVLEGLSEWPELNGKLYCDLPSQIKNGIGRRDLSYINLLKESTSHEDKAKYMKKVVFERLNTGGMKLDPQEIRNALYDGPFNDLCVKLSKNETFRKLWNLPSIKNEVMLKSNDKYSRMVDVEIVLRFFAMKHVSHFGNSKKLKVFLDNALRHGNTYNSELLSNLEKEFTDSMDKIYLILGENAFCGYNIKKNIWKKNTPAYTYFDPLMIACRFYLDKELNEEYTLNQRIDLLKDFYIENEDKFDGKRQERRPIKDRTELYIKFMNVFL